jgi:hypothetical protein
VYIFVEETGEDNRPRIGVVQVLIVCWRRHGREQ